MNLDRAQESLKAAELCLPEGLMNSAASRAYYAMFQAAQVAMAVAGFREYLVSGLRVRLAADYGPAGVNKKTVQRLVYRAASFVAAVEEKVRHGSAIE
ncbi:MAG: HEPN domain-containing protein [Deltaproteobacteria bacterium]|nr:HEPN domain-containing protein [Deltaproteobacteria bacterium]